MTISRRTARCLLAGGASLVVGLAVNAGVQDGWWPLLALGVAALGYPFVVVVVMGVSGYSVVHHSKQMGRAIENVHGRRELTR